MSAVTIEEAKVVTPELVTAFERLVPHLSRSSPPPGKEDLEEMVAAPGTFVLVARLASDGEPGGPGSGEIVGTLTLVTFRIPTGMRAWIEDVIVDESAEGRGIGTALTERALELAAAAGAKTVDLTSRPSREAANHLYRKVGFELRDTNVWRMTLEA